MKTRKFFAVVSITAVALTGFYSCSSEESSATDEEVSTTASEEAKVSALNDEVVNEADQYVNTSTVASVYLAVKAQDAAVSPTVTITPTDSTKYPKTVTIDFGTSGFTGKRGNVLKGKLIVTVSDKMWKANSVRTITFDNFYVNDNKITGSKTVTYKGLNDSKNPYWTISVKDTITLATDGTKVIWNSERSRERISNATDNVKYSITGSSNGVNAKGKAYSMTIATPLIIFSNYPHFVQGTVQITTGKRTAVLDYGDGTKDAVATLTIGDKTKTITLKN